MEFIIGSIVIGAGATALFDLWRIALARAQGQPAPGWAMPGRWFAHAVRGRVFHDSIARAEPVANENTIGWVGHYAVGILWGALLLAITGTGWLAAPTLAPALIVGIVTIAAGWFLMSPGMGNGIANARDANPGKARALGLAAHVVFGIGLWLSALVLAAVTG